jgi:hypothetical protein
MEDIVRLHAALEPFIDLSDLRRCVAEQQDIYEALRVDRPPPAVRRLWRRSAPCSGPSAASKLEVLTILPRFSWSRWGHLTDIPCLHVGYARVSAFV